MVVTIIDDVNFSFTLYPIFKQLLELRIKKNICQFVTFILKILAQIRLFVVIFALGTVAFALIITHFLRECPISDCSGLVDTKLSKTLFRASSITMFFLVGAYRLGFLALLRIISQSLGSILLIRPFSFLGYNRLGPGVPLRIPLT